MVTFDHRDAGTLESTWAADGRWQTMPEHTPAVIAEALIVAAHPDDETLGAGGLATRLHHVGVRLTILLASRGDASHACDNTERRVDEFISAILRLAPGTAVIDLGLPDSELHEHADELEAAVSDAAASTNLIVAPWRGDGHRDHRIAGEAAARAATENGIELLEYPIWLWHWAEPSMTDVPWDEFVRVTLDTTEHDSKSAALLSYTSQTEGGEEAPILHEGMLSHFHRSWETFIRQAA